MPTDTTGHKKEKRRTSKLSLELQGTDAHLPHTRLLTIAGVFFFVCFFNPLQQHIYLQNQRFPQWRVFVCRHKQALGVSLSGRVGE